MSICLLLYASLICQIPQWEINIGYTPMSNALLAFNQSGSMDIFVSLGDHGLGGWTGSGVQLDGFPISSEAGVSKKAAAFYSPSSGHVIVYADNNGYVHMVDHSGIESHGWPVFIGPGILTGISAVDLDNDGNYEISFGTADSRVHLLDLSGNPVPQWPVQLPAKLRWQPSQLSLGGGSGYSLVCALVNTRIYVLSMNGSISPGWPVNTGYSSGSIPVTGDIDADGLGDVLFATHNKRLYAVSMSGNGIDGWPFFLDDRCIRGPLAIGRLDPDHIELQIAVSCVDSTVTLIDGDGSLAGTWRWPNFTDGRPTAPIIARTSAGMAVIVGTDNGSVYAWNAEGRAIQGFPIPFGQPVSAPPAAGDIDGDGNLELVVLGRTGKIAAYTISRIGINPGPWPQMLCDEANSGSYGVSFLPVVCAGVISEECSGAVSLSYQTSSNNITGISLAYSTNSGYTWIETNSFRDNGSSVLWYSDEDLPGQDMQECVLRITPYCPDGPGISGLSNIFHVDNNIPPSLYLSTSREESDGKYTILYSVDDPEGDIIQLQAQYSIDNQTTWRNAHLRGSTFEIAPWFYGEPVTWNANYDLGNVDVMNISLRVRAADSDPGPWSVLGNLHLDSDRLPSGQIIAPEEEVSGRISLGVRLADPEENPLEVHYEFSLDGGANWRAATVSESSIPSTGTYQYDIIWESEIDAPGFDGNQVRFRAIPEDIDRGIAVPSSPFHLDNNISPSIAITSPGRWETFRGLVPVTFHISDPEGGEILLELEYRIDGASSWISAAGLDKREFLTSTSQNFTVNWNSTEDLPGMERDELEIRLVAIDGDTVFSEAIGPLSLDNSRTPSVMQAAVSYISFETGTVSISFELSDPEERALDLVVTFSTDAGHSWTEAAVSGDLFGRYSSNYEGKFEWHYDLDLGGMSGTVMLKITPVSGTVQGTPRILEMALR